MCLQIQIKNCNNIDNGSISIFESKLNIKFGINGTGKSTIAKAVKYGIESPDKLKELTPFKVKNTDSETKPEVIIPESIKSVMIFNEEYLSQFVYKEDELLSNSFEIFIKTPSYLETEKNIEKQLETIKKVFLDNKELDKIILDFENLSKSFKTTKDGLSDASAISKGLKDGNKIENIPKGLEEYKPFIQNKEKCVSWLEWQIKGNDFSNDHDNCPYCVSPTDESKKVKIKSISENYDKNVIKNFIEIIRVLENLGDYFSIDSKEKLEEITKKTDGLLDEEKIYLTTIKGQIDSFLQRLRSLKEVSFHNLKDEKIKEKIESLKIQIDESFDKLKSDKTVKIVEEFNKSLDTTLEQITELQKNIGIQKTEISKSIEKNQKSINQFLRKAGYKYEVLITDENKDYKLRLKHIESDEKISRGNQYLSFGEQNAFALVLFMYEALSKKSDLIILDDPISSFDKNKKYAIMDMLFREDNSFKGKTVLMLTHDIEPIIDSVKVLHEQFENLTNACFISTKNNQIAELEITKDDLLSFSQICNQIIVSDSINEIVQIIYLRRYYESIDDKSNGYEVLSNLLHKRSKEEATDQRKEKIDDKYQKLSDDDFEKGIDSIKGKILSFDYNLLLNKFKDNSQIIEVYNQTEDSFAKIILFRILIDGLEKNKKPDDVFMKFINEIYHIENDFLFQLNPEKFDITPQFIIEGCDNFIKSLII
jgi:ABC-type Mn2+/Zn2+ transport system ATPase subunit